MKDSLFCTRYIQNISPIILQCSYAHVKWKKCKVRRSSKSFTTCDPWGIFISSLNCWKRIDNEWKGILDNFEISLDYVQKFNIKFSPSVEMIWFVAVRSKYKFFILKMIATFVGLNDNLNFLKLVLYCWFLFNCVI